MSKILIAWELGSGLGHVGPLRAIGAELARRGHTVAIAAPNTELCRQAFAGSGVETVRAPSLPLSEKRLKFPCTYSDLLHDCGYSSAENLAVATGAWIELFDELRPDLLLADHSPTALLASRARDFATATIGTGFVCPPDVTPLPSLRKEIPEPHWAAEVEQTVLTNMNAALAAYGSAPLSRVTEVFGTVDRQYLLTLNELDHYRRWRDDNPREIKYWPPVGTLPGRVCDWPSGPAIPVRPRVFVYLRENETLLPILRGLAYKRFPTICYAPRFSDAEAASFGGSSVCVSRMPVDISRLTAVCDVAVLHGGNSTVGEFLRAGVPMLVLPLMLEQQITAERVAELHAGLHAQLGDLDAIGTKLEELIEDASYDESARSIAAQISRVDEEAAVGQLVDDMEQLAAARERGNF
jgi:UDP-N-acetylglucosamine:LPS N-acetylglucosamine transferase